MKLFLPYLSHLLAKKKCIKILKPISPMNSNKITISQLKSSIHPTYSGFPVSLTTCCTERRKKPLFASFMRLDFTLSWMDQNYDCFNLDKAAFYWFHVSPYIVFYGSFKN